MTEPTATPGTDPVCPWLGLFDDRATHFTFPSSVQRCHSRGRPAAIEAAKQARDCLTAQHVACSWYRPPAPAAPRARPLASDTARPLSSATTGLLPPDTTRPRTERVLRTNDRGSGRPPRGPHLARKTAQIGLFVVLLVAITAVGLAIGSRLGGQLGGAPGSSTLTPLATASSSTVPPGTPSQQPSVTITSTPAPTPSPTPGPTLAPRSTPAPTSSVYVVRSGDTLTLIAARYGVTVAALVTANGLKAPNAITVGQQLVIPAP